MLNNLARQINEIAKEKGFWQDMNISLGLLRGYGVYAGTIKATKDAFIAQKITLVHAELSEAIEAMRNNKYGTKQRDTFENEIADAIMRLLDITAQMGIDIDSEIAWKMDYNLSRAQKHGKEF